MKRPDIEYLRVRGMIDGEQLESLWTEIDSLQASHKALLEIHEIVMCIAECPPRTKQDTYTVGAVKDMAHRINQWVPEKLFKGE